MSTKLQVMNHFLEYILKHNRLRPSVGQANIRTAVAGS